MNAGIFARFKNAQRTYRSENVEDLRQLYTKNIRG